MKEKIRELFAEELQLISDNELREKVVAAWEIALRESDFDAQDLDTKVPFTLLPRSRQTTLARHVKAVTQVAYESAKKIRDVLGIEINMDYVVAGALLHDVAKVLEYTVEDSRVVKSYRGKLLRHPISGAQVALNAGLPAEIQHIIAVHSREGDGGFRTPEAYIVHHADFMTFDVME